MYIKPNELVLREPYWQGLLAGKLLLERCAHCGKHRFPPSPICASCHSFDTEWIEASGSGQLYSYTIIGYPVHPALSSWIPYNIALVQLNEGVRMISSLKVETTPISVGMALRCVVHQVAPDFALPYFIPDGQK